MNAGCTHSHWRNSHTLVGIFCFFVFFSVKDVSGSFFSVFSLLFWFCWVQVKLKDRPGWWISTLRGVVPVRLWCQSGDAWPGYKTHYTHQQTHHSYRHIVPVSLTLQQLWLFRENKHWVIRAVGLYSFRNIGFVYYETTGMWFFFLDYSWNSISFQLEMWPIVSHAHLLIKYFMIWLAYLSSPLCI